MEKVTVLDPTGSSDAVRREFAGRIEGFESKRVVLFWNAKKNGDSVLEGVLSGLQSLGVSFEKEVIKKEVAIAAASEDLLRKVSRRADVVINAVAD